MAIVATKPAAESGVQAWRPMNRIAAIDWMRGLVMVLMVVDHASMAFDATHISQDSAMYPGAATMALPAAAFFTRWMAHICAPTFVFLAGVALALSVERRAARGMPAAAIDQFIITRGAVIALLERCARSHPNILSAPEPRAYLENMSASALEFSLRVHLGDVNRALDVRSELRVAFLEAFRSAGIPIV